jgi:glycosyltransferase involved in cell wall biosynthesis
MRSEHVVPKISVGLPVRNASETLERCLGSLIGQDIEEFEVVVSDNDSDDGTDALLRQFAAQDQRVKIHLLDHNIGQHANMNLVFDRSSAPLFRWISADDWLEPSALGSYVDALAARPDAIGATSFFRIHADTGETHYEEFRGDYPDSPDPVTRFERILRLFHAGEAKYDPFYSTYRRETLLRTPRLRHSEEADWLLSLELALLGPIVNVDRCLTNRTRSYTTETDKRAYRVRMHPEDPEGARSSIVRFYKDMVEIIDGAGLQPAERNACVHALRRFAATDALRRGRQTFRWTVGRTIRRLPGGTRLLEALPTGSRW